MMQVILVEIDTAMTCLTVSSDAHLTVDTTCCQVADSNESRKSTTFPPLFDLTA